jgi:2'-5' RNA ligase
MRLTELFNEVTGNSLLVEAKHEYGCVMVYFPVPKEFWDKIQGRIPEEALASEKDEDGEEKKGRSPIDEAHVTLLYGIHEDVPDEDVEAIIDTISDVEVTLRKISTFDNDEHVLKFDVEGEKLHTGNSKLSELPHTTNFPDYHPHLTIAYIKKGELTDDMTKDLSGEDVLVTKSDKVVYSKPDGTQKEYKL